MLYGGRVFFTVRTDDAAIKAVIEQAPSSSSPDYGTPFYDLFVRYNKDFYRIDPHLFSPAEVFINNVETGNTFHAGNSTPASCARRCFPMSEASRMGKKATRHLQRTRSR